MSARSNDPLNCGGYLVLFWCFVLVLGVLIELFK